MRVIHNGYSVANGVASLQIFGPFLPGDFLEALFIHHYVSDAAATIQMGLKQANDADTTLRPRTSGAPMLLPAIASGAGYEVMYPLLERITVEDGVFFAVFLDNTGGAATISGMMMLAVSRNESVE